MNLNKERYLKSILRDAGSKNYTFDLRNGSKIHFKFGSANTARFAIKDIVTIKSGNKVLFRNCDFANIPKFTAEFIYCGNSHWTFLEASGSEYVNVDPVYKVVLRCQKGGKVFVKDYYRIIKDTMMGKVLTGKRREKFEIEFLKLIDHPDSLDIDKMVENAVIKSGI